MMPATRKPKIKPMTPGVPHAARVRAYVAGAVVTFGLFGLAWKAWALQVDDSERYRALAAQQHALSVDIPAPRGEVVDVLGRPLAVTADADSVWANPRDIHDVTATAEKLAALVGGDAAALEAKLGVDRSFVWIDRHVTPEIAHAVRAAKLAGIAVAREPRRWYPGRAVGGPVIGRANIDGKGLDGIELAMDRHLTGTRGAGHALRDARGRRMFADGMAQPEPGATVRLTIDRSIQSIADTALAEAVTTHEAKSGSVVVLDVATSRVLAMASYPSYDPNGHGPVARNRSVTDVFEVGSVMKIFTIAAALDAGVVAPGTWFDTQKGVIQIGRKRIRDTHHDEHLTVTGIVKRSSNVGTVKIAQRLGREKLDAALRRFGFGAETGIELPGEQRGTLRPGARWRDIEFATISFGYGLTVTPLQIAAAVAAIGNRGEYRPPRIIDEVIDAAGYVVHETLTAPRQAISARAAEQMRAMMATTFEGGKDPGTAASIVVPGFACGGKTGTAEKWDAEAKRYAHDRHLSSFAGLAPLDRPRLAIVVVVDEPRGGDYYGGKVAGPVFAKVASEALRYLGVPGNSLVCPPPPASIDRDAIVPARTCVTPTPRPPRGAKPVVAPPTISVIPEPELELPAGPRAPDFRGMRLSRAIARARELGVAIDVSGSGRVVEQDPPAGAAFPEARVSLRFSDGDSRNPAPAAAAP